jgi:Asp/Glu/hydantoin racemase
MAMTTIRFINPNSSEACSAGIADAIASFRGADFVVETLAEGPPGIYSWQDWHAVVGPLCVRAAGDDADVFVVACASDPGIEAVRAARPGPVLGIFRCAVAAAMARAERFGVIALVDASIARHALALRMMGAEGRLAGEIAMNVSIPELLDPVAARGRLVETGRRLVAAGAQTVILGCTGMAGHRAAIEQAIGVPVIEPCQAAAGQALAIVAAGG